MYLCHDRLKTVPQAPGPLVYRLLENEIRNHLRNFSVENQGSCGGPRESPSHSPCRVLPPEDLKAGSGSRERGVGILSLFTTNGNGDVRLVPLQDRDARCEFSLSHHV